MLMLIVTLSIVVAVLWQRMKALEARVFGMELGSRFAHDAPPLVGPSTVSRRSSWSMRPELLPEVAAVAPTVAEPEPQTEPQSVSEIVVPAPAVVEPALKPAPTCAPARPRGGFEDVFGRRLPIWAGGATLAVAGFLVVRYSIEAGLLSPIVRIVLGFLFGAGLIAGAEAALRRDDLVGDPRVRQALAGAGVATLYGCILAAANLYALVGPATAFVGLAAVTVLAGGLSLRFGAPSAVLGLVGGLAAPALVGASQPNVPLLAAYLALAIGGLCALGRQQRWWWLGGAALAGGFGWGAVLILGGALDLADTLAVGAYSLALGVVLPLLVAGERGGKVRAAGALAGSAQLAALVALGGFAALHWGLFGLIAAALVWLSRREPLLADAPILALGVAVLLTLAWPSPTGGELAAVIAGAVVIFGMPAAIRVWRADARPTDAPTLAILALATGLVPMVHDDRSGLPALAGSAGAALVALRGWRDNALRNDARFATLTLPAALLLVVAGLWTLPGWAWAPLVALVAYALHHVAHGAADARVERGGWGFAALAAMMLVGENGFNRLFGIGAAGAVTPLVGWAVPAAVFAVIAVDRRTSPIAARAFGAGAALLGYGAAAQIVATAWLPLVPAAMILTLASTRRAAAMPALVAAAAVSLGWAALPLAAWAWQALVAASGSFVAADRWPPLAEAATRLAAPAGAIAAAALLLPLDPRWRARLVTSAALGGIVAAHLAVKQLFAIDTSARFVSVAMAERFGWELVLASLAAAAWRVGMRRGAAALGTAAFVHLAWFTGLVANPLLVLQAPGVWLALSYMLGAMLLWAMPGVFPDGGAVRDRLAMALIVVAGFTLLRQASHDPMVLSAGTGSGEQIARSLLALALAGGFLWHGIRRSLSEWRIASLALMLVAVGKVFLHDAAGLDGLARIASFAALGFSLIGVGWLYSRHLPAQDRSSFGATDTVEGK